MHIVIAGYGREGQQSARYFLSRGHTITVIDERPVNESELPNGVKVVSGFDIFEKINDLAPDMVIRTAGLAPSKIKTTAKVWSATNEFFQNCPAPIIGVTGSKGKGTTCSLIASILRKAGKKVHLVGNIGVPALGVIEDITPQDIVVYELSSFQLWDIQYSPHIAVIVHIEPDHLDVHSSFEEYIAAKSRIVMFQSRNDICIYHPTNKFSEIIAQSQPQFATHAVKYGSAEATGSLRSVYDDKTDFIRNDGKKLCPITSLRIPGNHNIQNAEAAISACFAVIDDLDGETIAEGLQDFTGLDHRLKFIKNVDGVKFYDDSIATTPGSAIAALDSFVEPKVLLLGGSSKGADFTPLAHAIADSRMRHIILYGQEADAIADVLDAENIGNYTVYKDTSMKQLVDSAYEVTESGDVVILSPACASFDMFKSYVDRGDQFIQAVQELKEGL